jgi:hypothetical protein
LRKLSTPASATFCSSDLFSIFGIRWVVDWRRSRELTKGGSIQSPFSAVRRADACFYPNPQQNLVRGILRVGLTALRRPDRAGRPR